MEVIVIQEFKGAVDGDIHPRPIKVDERITGDLAQVALDNGWAREVGEKAKKPSRDKMLTARRNKSGSASPPAQASRKRTATKSVETE
jgi:hypothetical protein